MRHQQQNWKRHYCYITSWYKQHGPFTHLYSDGELGVNKTETLEAFKRLSTEVRIRAHGQHARLAEARNANLRDVMHMIEEDLKRSNVEITFTRLYAEAIFAVNAFSFYNGVSPYNALYGRQPAFLPDLENLDFPKTGENSDHLREETIRQAGISTITQATSVQRIKRAIDAKTTFDGKQYKPGQLVDYHRPPYDKDSHGGWTGPCVVVANEPERGKLTCRHGARDIHVQYPDARFSL